MDWVAVSASNAPYEVKAAPFLRGLAGIGCPRPPIHLTVDYDVVNPVPGITYRRVESAGFKALNPIACLTHGDFLDAVQHEAPIILFTDCDIVCQRPLTRDELVRLERIQPGQVWVSWNNGEGDSLFHESLRIGPITSSIQTLWTPFAFERHPMYLPIYNTGVVAMHYETWKSLFAFYVEYWPKVDRLYRHYAKSQWLISYLITALHLDAWIWPETFHSHGCFNMVRPMPRRFDWRNGDACVHGEPILFRHAWEAPA